MTYPKKALCAVRPQSGPSIAVLLAALCVGTTAPTSATVLVPVDLPTMTREAGVIVHGRVVDVRGVLTVPHRTIESLVTLQVIESVKGAAGQAITFSVPGGQVGRFRRILVGAPEFRDGDEVIVFLNGRAPAMPTLVGLSQGAYRVALEGSRRVVLPVPVTGSGRVVRGDPSRRPPAVEAFVRDLQAAVEPVR
jgi:hypothetical protein